MLARKAPVPHFTNPTLVSRRIPLRAFTTTTPTMASKLRIGFVPEHFSTPLHFAQKHHALPHTLHPEPLGTGALTSRLKLPATDPHALDVAIGLTEGFVADLGKTLAKGEERAYGLVGTYVESPLCWGISTGGSDTRREVAEGGVAGLRGRRLGVSRVGSGSYVMAFVLAEQQGWLRGKQEPAAEEGEPFEVKVIGDFAALRASVRAAGDADVGGAGHAGAGAGAGQKPAQATDFFMWEHFTTKHYWDDGTLHRLGEISTPWPSWVIAARTPLTTDARLQDLAERLDRGREYYAAHPAEAVAHITGTMRYSRRDAEEWMEGVRFCEGVWGVEVGMVERTVGILRQAGVLGELGVGGAREMVAVEREVGR